GRLPGRGRRHLVPARHRLAMVRAGHRGHRRGNVRDDRNGPGPRTRGAARRAAGGVDRGEQARPRPGAGPGRPVRAVPRRASGLPGGRTHLDGPQPARARLPGGGRGHRGPPGRAPAGPAALRGQARRRGLRHDGRLPRRRLCLAGRPDGATGKPVPPRRDRRGRARRHGPGPRRRVPGRSSGPARPVMTPNGPGSRWSRRRVLTLGLAPVAVLACAGAGGAELVSRGVLPGRSLLEELDGTCSVPAPPLDFAPPGLSADGTFYSAARRRIVGYTIAYPPGHRRGDELPLVVVLHGYGGNHANALAGMSPAQAVALKSGGRPGFPMALVTVDGGGGYWNPHPGDDPMAMVVHELIPRCQRLGLGRPPRRVAVMGISMGGYGALLL